MKIYGKYGSKVNWIVKWYGKYGRKVSWIVKRYAGVLRLFLRLHAIKKGGQVCNTN